MLRSCLLWLGFWFGLFFSIFVASFLSQFVTGTDVAGIATLALFFGLSYHFLDHLWNMKFEIRRW